MAFVSGKEGDLVDEHVTSERKVAGEDGRFRGQFGLFAGDGTEKADDATFIDGDHGVSRSCEATRVFFRFGDADEIAFGRAGGVWMEADGIRDGVGARPMFGPGGDDGDHASIVAVY